MSSAKDVEHYLASVAHDKQPALKKLRNTIKTLVPDAKEVISYQIPTFVWHGPLIAYAAWANHCSVYVMSKAVMERFKIDLKPFKTSGVTIHFTPENQIPGALVEKIVKARIIENKKRKSEREA